MKQNNNEKITIEDLARMVKNGFDESVKNFNNIDAKLNDLNEEITDIGNKVTQIDKRLFSIKEDIYEAKRKQFEKLDHRELQLWKER